MKPVKFFEKVAGSKSKTFISFCFCFIMGVGFFSFIEISGTKLYYLLICGFVILFGLIFWWKNKVARLILLCLLFVVLGSMRFVGEMMSSQAVTNNDGRLFYGIVDEEPNFKIDNAEYIVSTEFNEKVLIRLPLYPQYNYGDRLMIDCLPALPQNYPSGIFDYRRYLSNQGIFSVCFNPPVTKIGIDEGNLLKSILLKTKNMVSEQINRLFVEPESSLLAGLLYGGRSGLPKELSDSFRRTGLSHIVAVSGYNISIISVIFLNILIVLGFSRPKAFWLAIIGLVSFVIFTGASASVVRAGIMGSLVLIAEKVGRLSDAGRLLFLAGALILLVNPRLLVWDAGFQLSFLATLGLIYLTPHLWFSKRKIPELFFNIVNPTVAAIIATAPLIMFQFGQLSLSALPANVLVIWMIPWLMLFGFLSLSLGWIFYPLGQIIAWLTGFGLKYVIMVTSWFSARTWAAVEMNISWWMMLIMYLLIVLFFYAKSKNFIIGRRI
ncbi:MAG: hypothetical protein COU29_00455 [Candidatus Magasanikbacteria bacterium CG10_big_fil_rev_8_21_14_0_10_36_32]|uniref:ComEC/Rec2-related protein domain-containing protein n=1 Tax=Candidatus Magasanikbacteria bacterium CG10_big_fil_rev_8_21_14_0_10_36_32 TaxID=1974646 RepID=A0A2M6W7B7_9BACT|nr:MAG: hypothetical protein COU29_00455 [Candidatus Magasanikbacteria bacterium CG10_big_fil_rev_8_21_14_0_10_36_32]